MDRLKSDVLRKLQEAVSQDLVDEEVIPLLSSLNEIDGVVTTSSCSGRCQLITVPGTGDKLSSAVLGKWHGPVNVDDLLEAVSKWNGKGELHLLFQPLLLHIRTRDIGTAAKIRNLGQDAGLKFSTIRSIKLDGNGDPAPWGPVVELLGTERMEIPVDAIPKDRLKECLPGWVERGNRLMKRTKEHIPLLMELIGERFH
jgi:tRNA(Phe) wybutosine-synthesizing methylase Tyw3